MTFRPSCRLLSILGLLVTLLVGAQLVEHYWLVAKWTGERLGRRLLKTPILQEHCNKIRCYSMIRLRADATLPECVCRLRGFLLFLFLLLLLSWRSTCPT